jgi:uncharacterized membrane protein
LGKYWAATLVELETLNKAAQKLKVPQKIFFYNSQAYPAVFYSCFITIGFSGLMFLLLFESLQEIAKTASAINRIRGFFIAKNLDSKNIK